MANKRRPYVLVCFDGTGPYSEDQYANDFKFSFMRQARQNPHTEYLEGPGTVGLSTWHIGDQGVDAVWRHWTKARGDLDVYLEGYSRGGAAAIDTARKLGNLPSQIPVKALFLLDPVKKDITVSGKIAWNVEKCYTMLRDQTISTYDALLSPFQYKNVVDWFLVAGFGFRDPDRYARKFMHNCDTGPGPGHSGKGIHMPQVIQGASHGAMGGLPWVERLADQAPAAMAAATLTGWFHQESIPITVADRSFDSVDRKKYPVVDEKMIAENQEQIRQMHNDMTHPGIP